MSNSILQKTVERLLAEGQRVLKSKFDGEYHRSSAVDRSLLAKWLLSCRHLLSMLGSYAEAWSEPFNQSAEYYEFSRAERMQAALMSIQEALQHNLLLNAEDLILADTFSSLLEQAEYLLEGGYFLAAGVLGRAVLEEHLRKWAHHAHCTPPQAKPTLASYYSELYRKNQFNTLVLKHIEAMAAIGNDAAHNKPNLTREDVHRLIRDLKEFLRRYTLSHSVV